MAYWCDNRVVFQGEAAQMQRLYSLIRHLMKMEAKYGKGQLFPMNEQGEGYLFNIDINGDEALCYLTKKQPNIEVIKCLADHLDLQYNHHYEQLYDKIYGECIYYEGELRRFDLETEDFDTYNKEESGGCTYLGLHYSDESEILEALLDRKKNLWYIP